MIVKITTTAGIFLSDWDDNEQTLDDVARWIRDGVAIHSTAWTPQDEEHDEAYRVFFPAQIIAVSARDLEAGDVPS